jgi:4-aminobutyrate aminotransferase/(S)-3-amino-2-methylpropionate transaminase
MSGIPSVEFRMGRTIKLVTPIPGPESQALLARRAAAVPRGVPAVTPIAVVHAENAVLIDADGNRLIDFGGGIGVVNVGHRHPAVVDAIRAQLDRFIHVCFPVSSYEPYVALAERMNAVTPGAHAKRTFFVNSGAEAVENAVKVARAFTGRQAVVCFEHGFHGRTNLAMALTSKVNPYKKGFGPFAPEVYRIPYPYCYRCDVGPVGGSGGRCCQADRAALERLFAAVVDPDSVAAIVMELETGLPLGAVTGRAEVMEAAQVGGLGGTYGGNPLACAAALAVLEVMERECLPERAARIGGRIAESLRGLAERCPWIGDVRGLGAMMGMEIVKDRGTKEPDKGRTAKILAEALKRGVVLLSAGTYGNVVRILVPVTVEEAVLEEGLGVVGEVVGAG